ncbi:MAG: universal stress protein [Pyrinomonadaceae bacterium]
MKVILATDGTKYGEAAAEMVAKLNLGEGDAVTVISVVDMAVPLVTDFYGGYLPDTTELEKYAKENAAKVVESAKTSLSSSFEGRKVDITGDIQFGSPGSRIVETAEEIGADLIVIGSHGYKQWERILLGSVSSSVVHHAPCSVLVVRLPAE